MCNTEVLRGSVKLRGVCGGQDEGSSTKWQGGQPRGLPEGDKPSLKDRKVLDDAAVSPVGQDFNLRSRVRRWGDKVGDPQSLLSQGGKRRGN